MRADEERRQRELLFLARLQGKHTTYRTDHDYLTATESILFLIDGRKDFAHTLFVVDGEFANPLGELQGLP